MANDNISFLGVGRFRGYWNVTTNSGTLTSDGGYHASRVSGAPFFTTGSGEGATSSAGGFHTASKAGGDALTATAGDYFQVSHASTTVTFDSESSWSVNDYVVAKSGSGGSFNWVRLSYTDTVSSMVRGGLDSSSLANALLDQSGTANSQVVTVRTVDGSSSFSGSNNLKFHNASNTLQLTGNFNVSGSVTAIEFNTRIVSSSILYQSGSTKFGDGSNDVHDFTGSVYLGHNLNVTGSTTLAGTTTLIGTGSVSSLVATGTISGSSNLEIAGNTIIVGTLNVTGNANFDGTIACDDSITIDSVTITDTEIGYLDGLTLGTVAASKAVTVDSNKDFAGHRNMSGSGILENVGNTILGGNLNISGTTILAGGVSGLLSGSGNAQIVGTLGTIGNVATSGSITAKSTITTTAGQVFINKSAGGDPLIGFLDGGNETWTIGSDQSDSDALKFNYDSSNTQLANDSEFKIDSDGNVTIAGAFRGGAISGSSVFQNVGNSIFGGSTNTVSGTITGSKGKFDFANGNIVITGAYYGDGSGLTGVDSVSGSTRHYSSTGLETSGYLKVSGSSTLTAVTATSISGSGALTAVGNTVIVGTLNVTGNANFDGTITCDDSITIDSVTITDTEIGYLDGLTLGTVAASKTITVDSNKDFAGHRNMSGSGILQNVGAVIVGGALSVSGSTTAGHIVPAADVTYDLGSVAKRWRNIYTGDLHLKNDRGDWTIVEEETYLSVINNKTGKVYKMVLEEV